MTAGEIELARSIFGHSIDYTSVRMRRRKWFPFQPRKITMAPQGHMHFHPKGDAYCEDFSSENLLLQGFFIHEMTHIWQAQTRGRWFLVFNRHPFCRYDYALKPGQSLGAYGIEQQAEIVKHAFWLRKGVKVAGVADKSAFDLLVRFDGAYL